MKFSSLSILAAACALMAAAPAQNCLTTFFAANNGLSGGGATVYFDLATATTVTITSIEMNAGNTAVGTSIGAEIWTTPGTYLGAENDASVWTLVALDDGTGVAAGNDNPSAITLQAPLTLPPGTVGMAIVGVNTGQRYTNGDGTNEVHMGNGMTLTGGASTGIPFSGFINSPRVWNGSICTGGAGVGTTFCSPNAVNSTGGSTNLFGTLSTDASSGVHLDASQGPAGEFGYFLIGTGSADPGIAVGNGFLCLDTAPGNLIGRYNQVGGDQNSVGQFDASGVLQNIVSTSVAGPGFDVPTNIPIPGGVTIMAGSTWHFQVWHRDSPAGPGQSNFSNGLSVTF